MGSKRIIHIDRYRVILEVRPGKMSVSEAVVEAHAGKKKVYVGDTSSTPTGALERALVKAAEELIPGLQIRNTDHWKWVLLLAAGQYTHFRWVIDLRKHLLK